MRRLAREYAGIASIQGPDGLLATYHQPSEKLGRPRAHGELRGKPRADAMAARLAECHVWVANKNIQGLSPMFAPFWKNLPMELAAVSQKGIVWSLITYLLETHGPRVVLDGRLPIQRYALNKNDPIGDFVSLHIDVEYQLGRLARRLNLQPIAAQHGLEERKGGGLRTRQFVSLYPALTRACARHRAARTWCAALDRLIDASPLTRLVYADLVTRGESVDDAHSFPVEKERDLFTPLVRFESADSRDGSRWWHDLWVSHLGRSLLGALLSPPPIFESRCLLERQCEILKVRLARRPVRWDEWIATAVRRKLRELSAEIDRLKRVEDRQYLVRLPTLAAVVSSDRQDHDKAYLQVRLLDMLVRQLVAQAMPDLRVEWRRARKIPIWDRQTRLLQSQHSIMPDRLMVGLVGKTLEKFGGFLRTVHWPASGQTGSESADRNGAAPTANRWVQDQLQAILDAPGELWDPTGNDAARNLARAAGVPTESAQALVSHYVDNETFGVELPTPGADPRTIAPGNLLSEWVPYILERFSVSRIDVRNA